MGNLQRTIKQQRTAAILRHLEDGAKSTLEIAALIDVNYATARRDILDLVNDMKVKPSTLKDKRGKFMWVLGAFKHTPHVYVSASQREFPVYALSDAYLDGLKNGNKTTEAAVGVLGVAADLMNKAVFLYQGGTLTEADLRVLRKQLVEYKKFLTSTADIAEQMLKLNSLWQPETLMAIAEDEDFNIDRIANNYAESLDIINKRIEESKATLTETE